MFESSFDFVQQTGDQFTVFATTLFTLRLRRTFPLRQLGLGFGEVPAYLAEFVVAGGEIVDRSGFGWKLPPDCGHAFIHG